MRSAMGADAVVAARLTEDVLHLVKERAVLGLELGDGNRLRELLEELALFRGELLRHHDAHGHVQVAATLAAQMRHALAAHAERRSALRALGDRDPGLA